MAIFQKSVINSIKQDESLVASRWNDFQNYIAKIDAIRGFKEEVYQDGFFKDIFESCLGYTLKTTNPNDYNLEREKKNETDGKKADGVIYVNSEIIGIVELKDQKTKNLDAVEGQAFNYHNSHSNSKYVIISNFDELRFYIDKKTAYEKFNLFHLSYEDFKTLHLLISFESIRDNIPLKLKEKSASFEQTISKELYKDFSAFRTHLFENIVKNNYTPVISEPSCHPELDSGSQIADQIRNDEGLDKQTLLRLTQKLCDRIIFILFAEDRNLLKANTVKEIRSRHAADGFGDRSMYDYYKLYFNAINTGNDKLGIPKYNGGLFATDELLDSLKIDDTYLDMEAQKLSDFDFESDISVNILGHIFEQSLTDLEEMNASMNETTFDKKKSKRKKDGVFYTPEYITRYIVENTLGKLCSDKKAELKIEPETVVLNPRKLTKQEQSYKEILLNYREWLTHLKILDPACGSGAFLNQALEFLIREHTLIRDLLLPYEDLMIGYEIEKSILEHNLYGVDINEDAVEIAKLSLWLRTAHKGRELINLGAKIKCGNSLIADKSVAENAFIWEEEFPEVFNPRHPELDSGSQIADQVRNDEKRGFDVVIGNPPYTYRNATINKEYFLKIYKSTQGNYDLYKFFMEKCIDLFNKDGIASFIVPNTFLSANSYSSLRQIIIENSHIEEIYDLGLGIFENVIVENIVYTLSKKGIGSSTKIKIQRDREKSIDFPDNEYMLNLNCSTCDNNSYNIYLNSEFKKVTDQMNLASIKLSEISYVTVGINTGYIKSELTADYQKNEQYHKMLNGKDIGRYSVSWAGEWILYDKEFVKSFGDKGRSLPQEYIFTNEKILIQRTRRGLKRKLICYLDYEKHYNLNRLSNVVLTTQEYSIKYLYVLMNSGLMDFYFNNVFNEYEVKPVHLSQLPIKQASEEEQQPFIQKADLMLELTKELQTAKQNFINELHLEKTPQKLQNFEELEFDEFVKEYTKAKKLKFADKLEERNFKNDWSALFENDKKAVSELKAEIAKTDKEIDAMVYVLYGLSEDEIAIVEGSK
ncbi:MAG: N-6 DNA methylase [Sulfuricurvum sp.]|nr:N-6 DNA methylase [Sulfuricurvum sp.]